METRALADDAESAVVLLDEFGHRIIGLIVGKHHGFAQVQYTDALGIEHVEDLLDEDYELLEEWTKE